MTAKELFREISHMESFIETKQQRIITLTEIASSPGSPNYSGMPKSPNHDPSRMATIIAKKIDLENEVKADELRLQEKKLYALDLIATIESADYQAVLIKRYFEHLSWDDIISQLHYSRSWLFKIHIKAIEELDRKIAEQETERDLKRLEETTPYMVRL